MNQSKSPRVYVSKALSFDKKEFANFKAHLHKLTGATIDYYVNGTPYTVDALDAADIVLYLHNPDSPSTIGKGCFTEVTRCFNQGKKVYLAYKRKHDGMYCFYAFSCTEPRSTDYTKYSALTFGVNLTDKVEAKLRALTPSSPVTTPEVVTDKEFIYPEEFILLTL